eukprot:gene12079-16164_t
MSISIIPTKQYSVYEINTILKPVLATEDCFSTCLINDGYVIITFNASQMLDKNSSMCNIVSFNQSMKIVSATFDQLKTSFLSLKKYLIQKYDFIEDEFTLSNSEMNKLNIVRLPRIGRGKHNIHFDPEFSIHHDSAANFADVAGFSLRLSQHTGKVCTLRETGISLTRPAVDETLNKSLKHVSDNSNYGEGMEWHSDGAEGEFTILMSIENIESEMGSLRVVPGSHLLYVEGIGHDEDNLKLKSQDLLNEMICYAYRAGDPMVIDARTLHSVAASNEWRLVLWFIFDTY